MTFKPILRKHIAGQDCNLCPFYGYKASKCEEAFIAEFGGDCYNNRVVFLAEQPEQ